MKELKDSDESIFFEKTLINFKEEFVKYISNWKWFVLTCIITCFTAYLYLKYTPKKFSASAYVLITDNLKSGISDEFKAIADLGIMGNRSLHNPDNEIFIITSRKIVGNIVDSLSLNISYFKDHGTHKTEVFDNNKVVIKFLNKGNLFRSLDTAFVISYKDQYNLDLKDIEGNIIQQTAPNQIIASEELGEYKITIKNKDTLGFEPVLVVIRPRKAVVSLYASRIKVKPLNEFSSILHLQVEETSRLKAEKVLDELVKQYNLDASIEKAKVSYRTLSFIEARLQSVSKELAFIEDSLKIYKNYYKFIGNPTEEEINIQTNAKLLDQINELLTQQALIKWVQEEVEKQLTGQNRLLPANLGLSDVMISQTINEYNNLVQQKNKLELLTGKKNPSIVDLNRQIVSLKRNIKNSLKNASKSIEIRLNKSKKSQFQLTQNINQIPTIERGLTDISRQKIIYGELYSYLLKKKEEIAISLTLTVPKAKIIDKAFGSDSPVYPKKNRTYAIALAIGLIVPFTILYIIFSLDTKLHNRHDVEQNLEIPYLGDIPHSEFTDHLIVKEDNRSSVAEAFRLLRTNLNFMLPKKTSDKKGKLIFVTSTLSGEGKSFVSLNLASSLTLNNKKVLLVGLDLRAPKITNYLRLEDKKGLTNFILDDQLTVEDVTFTIPDVNNIDFIASGVIPPNPSELLLHPKVAQLFQELRDTYDYIIADTAPVSLVTDTLLVADLADVFLYVLRANYLDKKMLVVPKTLYKEKKLPNMAIVLNDTDLSRGYGYGYGYVEKVKKPWYKKILTI